MRGASAQELLKIDVDALAAYVDRLFRLYIYTNRTVEWIQVTDRLRENIRHSTWQRKVVYFRALSHLGPTGDQEEARRELGKIGPITPKENDTDILELYIDLELNERPF